MKNLGAISNGKDIITKEYFEGKIKTATNTTAGNIYDVTYINTMLGNIETLLSQV